MNTWLGERTPRERRLLAIVLGATLLLAVGAIVRAVRADLGARTERVATAERTLAHVRALAAELARMPATGRSDDPVLPRLETAASAVVGRERIAAMTPLEPIEAGGLREERVAVRLAGASLGEVVRLLHALEAADPPLPVVRLDLRKHPDDPRHFDATLEIAQAVVPVTP